MKCARLDTLLVDYLKYTFDFNSTIVLHNHITLSVAFMLCFCQLRSSLNLLCNGQEETMRHIAENSLHLMIDCLMAIYRRWT